MEKINTGRLTIGDEVNLKDRDDGFHKLVVVGII